jgi:hypothetical protein
MKAGGKQVGNTRKGMKKANYVPTARGKIKEKEAGKRALSKRGTKDTPEVEKKGASRAPYVSVLYAMKSKGKPKQIEKSEEDLIE